LKGLIVQRKPNSQWGGLWPNNTFNQFKFPPKNQKAPQLPEQMRGLISFIKS